MGPDPVPNPLWGVGLVVRSDVRVAGRQHLRCIFTHSSCLTKSGIHERSSMWSPTSNQDSAFPKGCICSCQVALHAQSPLKQQSMGLADLLLGSEESVSMMSKFSTMTCMRSKQSLLTITCCCRHALICPWALPCLRIRFPAACPHLHMGTPMFAHQISSGTPSFAHGHSLFAHQIPSGMSSFAHGQIGRAHV